MAGSDINVVSKNKAALSNVASNVATTVTAKLCPAANLCELQSPW